MIHLNYSRNSSELFLRHIWTFHVTHLNYSCHSSKLFTWPSELFMWPIWINHVTHPNYTWDPSELFTWLIWTFHVTHLWTFHVTHLWTFHVTHSCDATELFTWPSKWIVDFRSWPIFSRNITHSMFQSFIYSVSWRLLLLFFRIKWN